jgi:uncharacterized RDD family membrane protein YckC
VTCVTAEDTLGAMTYTATNPVAAARVTRADLWPGVNILPSDLGRTIKVKRPSIFFRADGPLPDEVELTFTPPPGLEPLSLQAFQARWQRHIEAEEARLRTEVLASGRTFAGRRGAAMTSIRPLGQRGHFSTSTSQTRASSAAQSSLRALSGSSSSAAEGRVRRCVYSHIMDQHYEGQMVEAGQGDPFTEVPPLGFTSAGARRRLKSRALKTAILAAVLDVVAPVILIFGVFFSMFSSACDRSYVKGAVLHQGQIYYAQSSDEQLLLMRTAPDGVGGVDEVGRVEVRQGWLSAGPLLVAAGRRLLLITSRGTFSYAGGQLTRISAVERPAGRPFVFRGKAAAARYDHGEEAVLIATLEGGSWRQTERVLLAPPDDAAPGRIEAHEHGSKLHIFTRAGGTIYHCLALPGGAASARCEASAEGDDNWSSALIDGAPAVFQLMEPDAEDDASSEDANNEDPPTYVVGRSNKSQRGWRQILREPVRRTLKIAALTASRRQVAVLGEQGMGDVRLLALRDGELASNRDLTSSYPLYITVIVLSQVVPFILAPLVCLVIGLSMRRARVWGYRAMSGASADHASLLRRGAAKGLDTLLFLMPLAALIPMVIRAPGDETMPAYLGLGLLAWAAPLLLIFSFLEGTWGVTPGKWLLGLRVLGDDLRPCGFSRALLRNVLGAADGALVYLVGMVVIALSTRQQRLGDMAARTVVIRSGTAT